MATIEAIRARRRQRAKAIAEQGAATEKAKSARQSIIDVGEMLISGIEEVSKAKIGDLPFALASRGPITFQATPGRNGSRTIGVSFVGTEGVGLLGQAIAAGFNSNIVTGLTSMSANLRPDTVNNIQSRLDKLRGEITEADKSFREFSAPKQGSLGTRRRALTFGSNLFGQPLGSANNRNRLLGF